MAGSGPPDCNLGIAKARPELNLRQGVCRRQQPAIGLALVVNQVHQRVQAADATQVRPGIMMTRAAQAYGEQNQDIIKYRHFQWRAETCDKTNFVAAACLC